MLPFGTPHTVLRRINMRRTKSLQDDCTLTPEELTEIGHARLRIAKAIHYPIEADVSIKLR